VAERTDALNVSTSLRRRLTLGAELTPHPKCNVRDEKVIVTHSCRAKFHASRRRHRGANLGGFLEKHYARCLRRKISTKSVVL